MKTTYGPRFTASKEEERIINKIANRAVHMAADYGVAYEKIDALMDLEACHCNGMPLALSKLLDADDANFGHDVFGIRRHINRKDGTVGDCFVPRYALPENAVLY